MSVVLDQVFPARMAAVKALADSPAKAGSAELRECATQARKAADRFGDAAAAHDWRALSAALEISALLADWNDAVREAESDADRFLRAARLKRRILEADPTLTEFGRLLAAELVDLEGDIGVEAVPAIRTALARVGMPVAIFAKRPESRFAHPDVRAADYRPEEVTVAFLEFVIDEKPVETLHSLSAGEVHDLDLTIRVSRWPAMAERLVIEPVSIEPLGTWDFPAFEVLRPAGEPPFVFERRGRMVLHASQGFNARPLEFRYAVEFQPRTDDARPVVAGQRTLRLDGTDTSRHPVTGYGEIDAKIVQLRERLRLEPLISSTDVRDLLTLLAPVGNLMGQAVTDKRYPDAIDEAAFQKDFQAFMRSYSTIGVELDVQPQITGGRADLSFRGVPIELKAERNRRLLPEDCRAFAEQAASYAIGKGRRVALLCVLDSSRKTEAPFPIADGLVIFPIATGTSPTYVVSCLLQGGTARPSDLSR